jgi:hypothetical protein
MDEQNTEQQKPVDDYWSPENVLARRRAQEIQDNMDRFYNPNAFYAREARRRRQVAALSEVFVGGLSYD